MSGKKYAEMHFLITADGFNLKLHSCSTLFQRNGDHHLIKMAHNAVEQRRPGLQFAHVEGKWVK